MVIGLGQGMTYIPAHESSDGTAKVLRFLLLMII
jgi:hypothetical protein